MGRTTRAMTKAQMKDGRKGRKTQPASTATSTIPVFAKKFMSAPIPVFERVVAC